jgi:hypothetical protein
MSSIRVILKHKETKRYLGRGGKWTDKPELAVAFLDRIRASDYRIYHRLFETEVVELGSNVGPNLPPPAPSALKQTPKQEEPVTKTRKTRSRVPKPAIAKIDKPRAIEEKSAAPQASEAPRSEPAITPTSNRGQIPAIAEPSKQVTTVEARVDVGYGNSLFIRGQGGGLSWDKGSPLECRNATTWLWSSGAAKDRIVFKLLLNDQVWAKGDDLVVEAGEKIEVAPGF